MSGLAGDLGIAARLARRELRGGVRGFRIFLACLALGVAAIAGIGSLGMAVREGLRADAQKILGGDVAVRLIHREASPAERSWLRRNATVSEAADLRAMAYTVRGTAGGDPAQRRRVLVELKGVDDLWPLYGSAAVDGKPVSRSRLDGLLAARNGVHGSGVHGALVDPALPLRLGVEIGDRLRIGGQSFEIRGLLTGEPDRGTRLFTLGPRILVSRAGLQATGLVRHGSLIYFHYRLKLPPGADAAAFVDRLKAALPKAGWRVRSLGEATPAAQRFLARIALYLTLVGLTALLVGGLGVANGVRAWLDGRVATVATFKCLGASARIVFLTYLIQVLVLALAGIAIGLVAGAILPAALAGLVESVFPVTLRLGLYPAPLAVAALFGLLTALAFSLWSVARAREVPPAMLFRQTVSAVEGRPKPLYIAITALLVAALAGLALLTAADPVIATIFICGCAGAFLLFRGLAWLVARGAARLSDPARGVRRGPNLRLALANIHRPGAPTASVILSLGLGATVLVAIALIQGNLMDQVRRQMPDRAPAFFFIDILPHQAARFDAAVDGTGGATRTTRMPMVRARIVRLNGVPAAEAAVHPDARWATRSERGLTYAAAMPEGSRLVAGDWWPADYRGPPRVSFDAELAQGMGLAVGDTITFNVLGREITATIANLRRVQWRTVGMNFTVIFAPGTLESAPHSHIAAVYTEPEAEMRLLAAVNNALPNVSGVRVRDALESAAGILETIGVALRSTATVTLLAGLLVLAGAIAAGHRRRVYDAVVLKVLGATRGRVLRAFLLEYGLLGLVTAAIAAVLGAIVAWAVLTLAMRAPWTLLPGTAIGTALLCLAVMLLFGFVGTWRAMRQKPAALLRNE
ncbi:MAG: FtsX-like permease family protein [Rhodospirillaceae bacterium]|nr:FtsX-like permease family protein [Rhodospirillaceae bacterium]MYB13012.1 FtsX-like permease family protein [Rhodospirillaceae bacterium]MYI51125.1 FtsX-like permease family protein [Rhodospirillaceae bacterium]